MLANGDVFHGDHHPVSVVQVRKSRNLIDVPSAFTQSAMTEVTCELPAGTYTLTTTPNHDTGGTTCLIQWYGSDNAWHYIRNFADKTKYSMTFTASVDIKKIAFYAGYSWSTAQGHAAVWQETQLEAGSTATPYEPYGTVTDAIFTPANLKKSGTEVTFEQSYNHTAEVEVAGKSEQVQFTGKNMLEGYVTSGNLWSTTVIYEDDPDTATGKRMKIADMPANKNRLYLASSQYPYGNLVNGETYTVSLKIKANRTFGVSVFPYAECSSGRPTTNGKILNTEWQTISQTFVFAEETRYSAIYLVYPSWGSEAFTADDVLYFADLQLEKGSTATAYEPYVGGIPSPNPDYPQPIESIDSVELASMGRNWDGFDEVANTYVDNKSGELIAYNGWYSTGFIPVSSKVTFGGYNTSGGQLAYYSAYYDSDKKFVSGIVHSVSSNLLASFKVPDGAKYIRTSYGRYFDGRKIYTDYHTATIDLQGNQLRSLPDGTHDTLVVKRTGECWIERMVCENRIGNMKNASKREWGVNIGKGLFWFRDTGNLNIVGANGNLSCLSDRLLGVPTVSASSQANKTICLENGYQTLNVRNDDLIDVTAAEAREYMRDYVVQYPLASPQTITLPSIDPIPTYWPTTVIDSNGVDVSAFVKVVE